jgi:hypothetical protein
LTDSKHGTEILRESNLEINIVRQVETEVHVGEEKKVGGIALGKVKEKRLLEETGRGLKNIR